MAFGKGVTGMSRARSGKGGGSHPATQPAVAEGVEGNPWIFVSEAERQEIDTILATIDARLAEAEHRADRVMARMGLS